MPTSTARSARSSRSGSAARPRTCGWREGGAARRLRSASDLCPNRPPHKVGASSARAGLNHYPGNSVFPESPCFGQERFTEGRYLHTMSPSWALADCPVCGVSFEAVGPDGVLVHLLASHPRTAAARWVDEQLAGSDPVWHGRSGSVRYLRIAEHPEAAGI
jgi:hypothetical protein